MAISKDIEVLVVATETGEPLHEYNNPFVSLGPSGLVLKGKYIEAKSGAEFEIHVIIQPDFKLHGAHGIRLDMNVDQETSFAFVRWDKDEVMNSRDTGNHLVISSTIKKVGSQRMRVCFSSADLEIDESLELERVEVDELATVLGCIRIKIQRFKTTAIKPVKTEAFIKPTSAIHGSKAEMSIKPPLKSDEPQTFRSSLKVVEDKNISHIVKFVQAFVFTRGVRIPAEPLRKASTNTAPSVTYDLLDGPYGEPVNFMFRYRSYFGLQKLGCIPRSPTPVALSEIAPTELTEDQKIQELNRLRAEVEQLASERDELERLGAKKMAIKLESTVDEQATSNNSLTPNQSFRDIIRERSDLMAAFQTFLENTTAAANSVQPRNSAPSLAVVDRPTLKRKSVDQGGNDQAFTNKTRKRARNGTIDLTDD